MATTNILGFGTAATNELSDAAYSADAQRLSGNIPGVARSQLVNKALHQLSMVAAGVAQYVADRQATNVVDTLTPSQFAAMMALGVQGRLVRILRYTNVSGVQNVSTNGAANTTTGATGYIPSTNMKFCIVDICGGGGGGGGAVNPTAGQVSLGAGGASGGYCRAFFLPASIGGGQTVTVGAGGTATSGAGGGGGGTSSLGALVSAGGGGGGLTGASAAVPTLLGQTTASGAVSGGNLMQVPSVIGIPSVALAATVVGSFGGSGGVTPMAASTNIIGGNSTGVAGNSYGCGGSGVAILNGAGPAAGGVGGSGVVFIYEYE